MSVDPDTGKLVDVPMAPMQARQLRLRYTSPTDAAWLQGVLDQVSGGLGSRVGLEPDGMLVLRRG